ncbi:hypothetical protein EV356DRAFT_520627 [Viridothelium virens]|uniref:Uncharacterized protein n=1 Tax=Viridothelium virens TaxID=1048519 RepID=A0A6A6GVG8_VIRVR|nr:hypothetical protein EV356DRAFT_520627 [Viridothelium virens]
MENDDDSITPSYVDDGSVLLTTKYAGEGAQLEKDSPSKVQDTFRGDRNQANPVPKIPVRVKPGAGKATASPAQKKSTSTSRAYLLESDIRRAKGKWDELRKRIERARESAAEKQEPASPSSKPLAAPSRTYIKEPEFEIAARDWN